MPSANAAISKDFQFIFGSFQVAAILIRLYYW